jgi:hypothetical protein
MQRITGKPIPHAKPQITPRGIIPMGDLASGQKKPDVFITVLSELSGFA